MRNVFWTFTLPLVFLGYSVPLFLRVYTTTQQVIDEEFHIPQGLHYCNKEFQKWNPKITTFPGLYLVAVLLGPLDLCTPLGLRLISLLAATANILLLFKIKTFLLGTSNNRASLAAFDALTIAALPPLYFFSHLYYSDALSLTMVLMFYYYWLRNAQLPAAVYAAASVLMRQTNVVWVAMGFGINALDILVENYKAHQLLWNPKTNSKQQNPAERPPLSRSLINLLFKCIYDIVRKCCFYMVIILPFIGFVIINGSIVLGDKQAHQAVIHVPQLFYFGAFSLFFGVVANIAQVPRAVQVIQRHKMLALLACLVVALIVHYNTLVHKYLLADNRHYIFYVWNRFYRFPWFRYAMAPIYVFSLVLFYMGMEHMRASYKLMFFVALFMALCFQRLLELRYFLVPFVLYRLHLQPTKFRHTWFKWLELSFYLLLNAITFYLFFTKEIKWKNYREPQRIIW